MLCFLYFLYIYNKMDRLYVMKWISMIATLLLIIGGLNWGLVGAFNFDLVSKIGFPMISKIIYLLVGLSAIYLAFNRNTYLPFLGEAVYPCGSLADKIPDNATIKYLRIYYIDTSGERRRQGAEDECNVRSSDPRSDRHRRGAVRRLRAVCARLRRGRA